MWRCKRRSEAGQPSECHPKVCKTRRQMQPCPHPGPDPGAPDAPRACRWAPGHRQQPHSTDNTQTTPARWTPTHPTTGPAIARRLPTWSAQEEPARSSASFLRSTLPKCRSLCPARSRSALHITGTQESWVRAGGPGGEPPLLGPVGFISGAGGGGGRAGGGEGNPKLK